MGAMNRLRICNDWQQLAALDLMGEIELGRQKSRQEQQFQASGADPRWRVAVGAFGDEDISRQQVRLVPLEGSRIRVDNLSARNAIRFPGGPPLEARTHRELSLPVIMTLGRFTVLLEDPFSNNNGGLQTLTEATVPPGRALSSGLTTNFAKSDGAQLAPEVLVRWIQTAMTVLHEAAGSAEFFTRAAEALVDLVGLDSGRVLLLNGDKLMVKALQTAVGVAAEADWQPSRQVLNRVLSEKRTFWQVPLSNTDSSLYDVRAVVASPILDRAGAPIGSLYGERRRQATALGATKETISQLEALLVELLATAVAAGLARLEQEQAALRLRVQFEQFFTPELAAQLLDHPDLLQRRDAEVTILFADIRAFSRLCEQLSPADSGDLIHDVMSALSESVQSHGGVLVEFMGDELIAMWGAPQAQPDHAQRACRAALVMMDSISRLDGPWRAKIAEPVRLGVGINTGIARVGNIGSNQKFKYGPLGHTVNLASRAQGTTKFLRADVLITQSTCSALDDSFATRRLGRVRMVNISEPTTVYELRASQPSWLKLKHHYEDALAHFERGDLSETSRRLKKLLGEFPDDGPTIELISLVTRCLAQPTADFNQVWEFNCK
jgi:adenylate cyclase